MDTDVVRGLLVLLQPDCSIVAGVEVPLHRNGGRLVGMAGIIAL